RAALEPEALLDEVGLAADVRNVEAIECADVLVAEQLFPPRPRFAGPALEGCWELGRGRRAHRTGGWRSNHRRCCGRSSGRARRLGWRRRTWGGRNGLRCDLDHLQIGLWLAVWRREITTRAGALLRDGNSHGGRLGQRSKPWLIGERLGDRGRHLCW